MTKLVIRWLGSRTWALLAGKKAPWEKIGNGEADNGDKTCPTLSVLKILSRERPLSMTYSFSVSLKIHEATW